MNCIEPGCNSEAARKQMCWPHYDVARGRSKGKQEKQLCQCGKPHYARKMCKSCYMVWFRSEEKNKPVTKPVYKNELNDFWSFVTGELEITGASTRKETI